jgi:DNA-binding NtrC family response regulator
VVLVVDDEECVLNTVCSILAHSGFDVLRAGSPERAMMIATQHREMIDLLLTDVVMPRLNGPELAEQFARLHPETRMLFMAGLPDNPDIHGQVLSRGRAFLPKPFLPSVLVEVVRRVLEEHRTQAAGA